MFTKLNSLCEVVETQRLQLHTLKTENQQLQQQVATLQKNQSRMLSLFQQLTGQTIPSALFGTALIDGFRETCNSGWTIVHSIVGDVASAAMNMGGKQNSVERAVWMWEQCW